MSLASHFKKMSNIFTINVGLTESAAHTFTTESVTLNVDPLSQEVIVVLAADIDVQGVNLIATKRTTVNASISTTTRTTVGGLESSNVIANKTTTIVADAANAVSFESQHPDSPASNALEWIGLVATDDIHLNIEGSSDQTSAGTMQARLWCIRAQVKDAGVYAALVQSELLG